MLDYEQIMKITGGKRDGAEEKMTGESAGSGLGGGAAAYGGMGQWRGGQPRGGY